MILLFENYRWGLNARDFLATVLTNLRTLFDNFGTKRAFTGKESFMDFLYGLIDRFLYEFISKLEMSDGLNGLQLTNIADHFRRF
jgi:hypothetical protein